MGPGPQHWKPRILTTRSPGNPLGCSRSEHPAGAKVFLFQIVPCGLEIFRNLKISRLVVFLPHLLPHSSEKETSSVLSNQDLICYLFQGCLHFWRGTKKGQQQVSTSWVVAVWSCVEHHAQPPCPPIHSSAPCHSRLHSTLRESIILMRGRLQRVGSLRYPLPCAPSLSTPILCPTCSLF